MLEGGLRSEGAGKVEQYRRAGKGGKESGKKKNKVKSKMKSTRKGSRYPGGKQGKRCVV